MAFQLPVIATDMSVFASDKRPLRPSKTETFLGCPMSVVLSGWDEDPGGSKAQTGNLIHDAVEAYHKAKADREAAGLAALAAARAAFPDGDPVYAEKISRAYFADPANQTADVIFNEQPVRLELPCAPYDHTGLPVVIQGTLDQVRRETVGGRKALRVWDIKTGDRFTGEESLLHYAVQQAVYVLAARASLDPSIEPGGLIYTPAYTRNRGSKFIPFNHGIDECWVLVQPLVHWAAAIRNGEPIFRPDVERCKWCDHRPWPKCIKAAKTILGFK